MKRFLPICLVVCLFSILMVAQQVSNSSAAQSGQGQPAAQSATPTKPAKTAATQPAQAETTVMEPDAADPNDPLFGVPPLPKGPVSLIGGTVQKVDRVRNRVTVKTFGEGGKKMTASFDERTHIYRDGVETTERGIRRGDRAYLDTMLDGTKLFARNIRVVTNLQPSAAQGQILSYNPATGSMTVRDDLSSAPVSFFVTRDTKVKGGDGQGRIELVPGSLVTVQFTTGQKRHDLAREITVLAQPGNMFTFEGKVRHLDLRSGTLVVENAVDNKTYELQFRPGVVGNNVMVGTDVSVSAEFIGRGYQARTVTVNQAKAE